MPGRCRAQTDLFLPKERWGSTLGATPFLWVRKMILKACLFVAIGVIFWQADIVRKHKNKLLDNEERMILSARKAADLSAKLSHAESEVQRLTELYVEELDRSHVRNHTNSVRTRNDSAKKTKRCGFCKRKTASFRRHKEVISGNI